MSRVFGDPYRMRQDAMSARDAAGAGAAAGTIGSEASIYKVRRGNPTP